MGGKDLGVLGGDLLQQLVCSRSKTLRVRPREFDDGWYMAFVVAQEAYSIEKGG